MFDKAPEVLDASDSERLELEYHVGEDLVIDLEWLRKTMSDADFVDLSLAIAELTYRDRKWEILEREEFLIVTNQEREGGSSLLLVDATDYEATESQLEQVRVLYQARIDQHAYAIARITADLQATEYAGACR